MRTCVTRAFTFDAAHELPWHPGKCRQLHGHTYRLEVTVEGPVGDQGVVCDFADLADLVRREVIDRFDHRYLNDLLPNPTPELVVADVWKRLEAACPPVLRLTHLKLWETPDSAVELWP